MANFYRLEERPTWSNMKTPKIMERMLELYETRKWHDCVFKLWNSDGTGEELVLAHNLVLASCSPVFEALCFGPLAEDSPIEVPDIDPLAFKMMLKFIYTDSIEFNSVEMACDVLYASKKYLIYSLAGLSVSYILYHINESNCLQVYNFATFIQEESLLKESWSYLCSHLDDVSKYFSYESLTRDLVKNLVNEEALNGDEITLYKICLMWAEAECESNNLEKSCKNLRKVLIQADLLNKIRWLTLSLEEFEEGPQKSGILTNEEINFISRTIKLINDICSNCENQGNVEHKNGCKVALINGLTGSDCDMLQKVLLEGQVFPFSINNKIETRKKIQLKKLYCHRFIETEIRSMVYKKVMGMQNELKICTYIVANKSVRLTAIFLSAKSLPLPQLTSTYALTYGFERKYNEKLFVTVCDSDNLTMFSTSFYEKVSYGTVFKIALPNPITLERSKEYSVQVDLLNSPENYFFGVRNPISKFPSGLCVTFKEKASIGENGSFIEAKYLSIISGLELCV